MPSDADLDPRLDDWTVEVALAWVAVPVLGWMMARFAYALVRDAGSVSRLADGLRRIELIDPTPLAPFVQQSLGGALLVIVMRAIGMGGAVGQAPVLPSSAATVSALFGVGAAALVLPVLGVRRRIRGEKRAELRALLAGPSSPVRPTRNASQLGCRHCSPSRPAWMPCANGPSTCRA